MFGIDVSFHNLLISLDWTMDIWWCKSSLPDGCRIGSVDNKRDRLIISKKCLAIFLVLRRNFTLGRDCARNMDKSHSARDQGTVKIDDEECQGVFVGKVCLPAHKIMTKIFQETIGIIHTLKWSQEYIMQNSWTDSTQICNVHELRWECVLHPPYCPDLAPSYYLYPNLTKWLSGEECRQNEEVNSETSV